MDDFDFGSGFGFTGATIDDLGATEYTLVTIALDETGSIQNFESQIREMLILSIEACKKSPHSNNLLVRVIRFGSQYAHRGGPGVDEVHGFKTLSEIDTAAYPTLHGGGGTPLYDAVYSGVGAANTYAKSLTDMDFGVNGITIVITDGENTRSIATAKMVADELKRSTSQEVMESHLSILVGIDTGGGNKFTIQQFQTETGMDKFIWAGDATPGKLAKLAEFVSQSISSTSQALGTGGPSQNISATI
jgi:hypothetical protein